MSLTVGILGTASTVTVQQIRPVVDVASYPANVAKLSGDGGEADGVRCSALLGGYTTRIFVAQAIVAAVICGFVN